MTYFDPYFNDDELFHYGILRESGRYPWGSGKDNYQRSMDFYAFIDYIKEKLRLGGHPVDDKEIAKAIGLEVQKRTGDPNAKYTLANLRDTRTIAKEEIVSAQTQQAKKLRETGMSPKEIGKEMGIPEPTVRLRIKNSENMKQSTLRHTADMLRSNVDKHKIVDIGKGTELNVDTGIKLGISKEKLRAAVSVLHDEGYVSWNVPVPQVGSSNFTYHKVLCPPGTTFGQAKKMIPDIHTLGDWTEDDGETWLGIKPPISVSSKRLRIVYDEDGGGEMDGVVFVRPNVKDLDMGKNTYAQVRILVDDTHYIKGMAIVKPDLPAGVDLLFHTNKSRGTPKMDVLKPKEPDPANPFGSSIKRQIIERTKDGKEVVTSALNLVYEAGDWDLWHKSLPSQMLAKQPHSLIKSQLTTTRKQLQDRLDEIATITNPVVRKEAYKDFADQVESDAVDLRAAHMPRQRTQVVLPVPSINKKQIYAPNFETGENVVLIRYPHGGRFEIPEVTVNNNHRASKALLGQAPDAIGIHPDVAARLSGADFDGDTVIVIPNPKGLIKGVESMGGQANIYDKKLNGFEPKRLYGDYKEDANGKGNFKLMTQTGKEMGMITNLITDMQVQGAKPEHIVDAVRHSMVVIDAEKHKLDYKQSELDHGIKHLRELYQSKPPGSGKKPGGASTLLSRATAEVRVPQRKVATNKDGGPINLETGAVNYVPSGKQRSVFDKKTGTYLPEKVDVEEGIKRLRLEEDAYTLVRDPSHPIEKLYADHANAMKALANSARLTGYLTPNPPVNKDAKVVYADEVAKLKADLDNAKRQKPLDRRAQVYANATKRAKYLEDPTLRYDKDRVKKVERQALAGARARLGLSKPIIEVTPRQWDAIQSGAISSSMLTEILGYADPKVINDYALPRSNPVMTNAISGRAKAMLAANNSVADVAAALGISTSTLKAAIARGDL